MLPGRVYNVTHYMDFHPGGDTELMRGVGQDGTNLFSQVGSIAGSLEAVLMHTESCLKIVVPSDHHVGGKLIQ